MPAITRTSTIVVVFLLLNSLTPFAELYHLPNYRILQILSPKRNLAEWWHINLLVFLKSPRWDLIILAVGTVFFAGVEGLGTRLTQWPEDIASFPGLLHLQFLHTVSNQKLEV